MAGNLKQRLIKAGRDFNYAEGVKVLNNTASIITADTIVMAKDAQGPFLMVEAALGTVGNAQGRLLIMKHDLPANGYGVALPWKKCTGAVTGFADGAVLYINDDGTLTATSGDPAKARVVGHVLDASDGTWLFSGEMGIQVI